MKNIVPLLLLITVCACKEDSENTPSDIKTPVSEVGYYEATRTESPISIDGVSDEDVWDIAPWAKLETLWLGDAPTSSDFSGRYKMVWDKDKIYLMAEITDDVLLDIHADGLDSYWDDDCLEFFVDEDRSGGDHQYSYNAFAYHVAIDGKVVDLKPNRQAAYFTEHVDSKWTKNGNVYTWELAISVYADTFSDSGNNTPVNLATAKELGYALAYCDNDTSPARESFIGSIDTKTTDDIAWKDASVFGLLKLIN